MFLKRGTNVINVLGGVLQQQQRAVVNVHHVIHTGLLHGRSSLSTKSMMKLMEKSGDHELQMVMLLLRKVGKVCRAQVGDAQMRHGLDGRCFTGSNR